MDSRVSRERRLPWAVKRRFDEARAIGQTHKLTIIIGLALVGALLTAGEAWACPACAGSNKSYAAVFPVLLSFIGVPFLVAGVVAGVIWRWRRGGSHPHGER